MTTNASHSARRAPVTGHHARPPPATDENADDTPMTPPGPGGGSNPLIRHLHRTPAGCRRTGRPPVRAGTTTAQIDPL